MWVDKDMYLKLSVRVSDWCVFHKECTIANGLGECSGLSLTSNQAPPQLFPHFPTPRQDEGRE